MLYREAERCHACNKPYKGIYDTKSKIIGDTFMGWDYGGHKCDPVDVEVWRNDPDNIFMKVANDPELKKKMEALISKGDEKRIRSYIIKDPGDESLGIPYRSWAITGGFKFKTKAQEKKFEDDLLISFENAAEDDNARVFTIHKKFHK